MYFALKAMTSTLLSMTNLQAYSWIDIKPWWRATQGVERAMLDIAITRTKMVDVLWVEGLLTVRTEAHFELWIVWVFQTVCVCTRARGLCVYAFIPRIVATNAGPDLLHAPCTMTHFQLEMYFEFCLWRCCFLLRSPLPSLKLKSTQSAHSSNVKSQTAPPLPRQAASWPSYCKFRSINHKGW